MKTQEIYQVDAFASELFRGNPAAVCILEQWLPVSLMQAIASENNLSETAFAVPEGESTYAIRWFTPENEVALCGHATLATAHVLFETREPQAQELRFQSRERGALRVRRKGEWLELDFPAERPREAKMPQGLAAALGKMPDACYKGLTDYMLVYPDQETIESLDPDHYSLGKIDCRGVIVTAPGVEADFVSRFFAPRCGVPEDPVTGSAHTLLIPYWSEELGKETLLARQLSRRGGELQCQDRGQRVGIAGRAITYMKGEIYLPE
ncbi:PhzF family phenazine biosynthesis protein [Robiginitalea sediminis]|uniref:PhzF family phenazine biosynthesis protein n=1 Tax=Robiginitalea sediminis TaxID=1982593 RepID=UPI000B4A9BFE|nr:PhzF family phenazine biosynthesis protein [Robiginitalea sediminis]